MSAGELRPAQNPRGELVTHDRLQRQRHVQPTPSHEAGWVGSPGGLFLGNSSQEVEHMLRLRDHGSKPQLSLK